MAQDPNRDQGSSLGDREFQAHRRVRKGRTIREGETTKLEQFALAVVDPDGRPLSQTTESLLQEMLWEMRRTNMLLQVIANEEIGLSDVA